MLLDLTQLRGPRERLQRTYDPQAFEVSEDYEVVEPVTLVVDIHKEGARVHLVGQLRTGLALACVRCLERFSWPVDVSLDLRYVPHSANTGEGEVEIEEDDLDTAFYREESIDLGQLIHEQFYLALPMKPLCSETCRGICPQCGANRNVLTCDCTPSWEDPRLAGLKRLLTKDRRDGE